MKEKSTAEMRQQRFLLVLPVLVLPFLTLMFWALGGGSATEATAQVNKKGLSLTLPDANFGKEKQTDKMSYYDNAASDSVKLKELMKNDPFYDQAANLDQGPDIGQIGSSSQLSYGTGGMGYTDPNEARVYQKLQQLDQAMNAAPPVAGNSSSQQANRTELERLEKMMAAISTTQPDPEMQQINGMLESILDIQHPDRVQDKLRKNSELKKGQVFAVSKGNFTDPISTLEGNAATENTNNGFFSFDKPLVNVDSQNAISAVVHEDQTIVTGATVKLRLTDNINVNGILIPKDNFIYGLASLSGERLIVKVDGIRYRNSLFPVSLSVYDLDGVDGIYVPGAISRDVAKSSADRSIQNIGIATLDPSLGAQAAGAGIEAAKSLFSKKVKLVKVMVKAGYQVLLKDEKQKQQQ